MKAREPVQMLAAAAPSAAVRVDGKSARELFHAKKTDSRSSVASPSRGEVTHHLAPGEGSALEGQSEFPADGAVGAVGGYQIRRRDSLAAAQLYVDAAEFELDLPDLTVVEPDEVATVLLSRFFTVWEEDTTFVALLRASMRQVIRHPGGAETRCHHARSPRRAGRIDGRVRHWVGHMARYVLANPAVANLSHDELICWAAPVIRRLLAGPAPT